MRTALINVDMQQRRSEEATTPYDTACLAERFNRLAARP